MPHHNPPLIDNVDDDGPSLDQLANASPEKVEHIRQHYRAKARQSLYWFARVVIGHKDMTPAVHMDLCTKVQDPTVFRLLALMPRGGLKSSICTIAYPVWLQIQEPDNFYFFGCNERILIANASQANASKFLISIEVIYEHNYFFRWLFPELIPNTRKVPWSGEAMRIVRTINTPTESIEAMGVGSRVTGRHYTKIINDDLIEKEASESIPIMQKSINWYKYTHSLLEKPERDKMIVTGTKWCPNEYQEEDLYAYIEDKEPEYETFRRSAYIDGSDGTRRSFWEDRFSLKFLEALEKKDPAVFACQQLNDPISDKATDWSRSMVKTWIKDEHGNIWVDGTMEGGLFVGGKRGPALNEMNVYILFDPAISLETKACDSAILVVGCDADHRRILLNVWAGRRTTDEIVEHWIDMQKKYPILRTILEAVLFQKLYKGIFTRAAKEENLLLMGGPEHIIEHRPSTVKIPRIRAAISEYMRQGELYVNPEQERFLQHIDRFPKGKIDDLDALAMGDLYCEFPFRESEEGAEDDFVASRSASGVNPDTGY